MVLGCGYKGLSRGVELRSKVISIGSTCFAIHLGSKEKTELFWEEK